MNEFWTVKVGYILVGAVAGGGGYFILSWASNFLKISDTAGKRIAGYGAIACSVIAVNLASPVILQAVIQNSVEKADTKITQAIAEAKPLGVVNGVRHHCLMKQGLSLWLVLHS